jgi:phage shock protein A
MAGGGIFARLGNLWRGFLSLWISDVEKQHPEIAYENAINSMIAKYTRLKTATASIIRRREDIDTRNQKARSDLAEVQGQLAAALDTNQDDLAVVLIQKQSALEKELVELRAELDLAQKDADSAKSSLITVQSEIRKLKSERDSMLAKMQSAQARIKIQEQLDGLSVDAEVKALDNVREHIKTTIAEANLGRGALLIVRHHEPPEHGCAPALLVVHVGSLRHPRRRSTEESGQPMVYWIGIVRLRPSGRK